MAWWEIRQFYGDGLDSLPLADRATIANMSPEYGATCGFFPIDAVTLDYMRLSGAVKIRSSWSKNMPKRRACGVIPGDEPIFTSVLELDLSCG